MRRIVLFCSLVILMFVNVLYAHAETFEIPLDDSYVEGVIVPLATEKMSAEENEVQVYSFHLEEPGNIDLHFISHVNNMRFQIKDIDENVIEDDYIRSEYSPKDYKITLDVGTYTLHIIKIAPTGLMGVRVSEDNVGDYKFKMKYSPVIDLNNESHVEGRISLGQTYGGFFQSRNDNNTVEKMHELNIPEDGTYILTISSDMALNYSIKDIDENVIGSGSSYVDANSNQEVVLLSGIYNIVCNTSQAGSYQILVQAKDSGVSNEEDSPVSQEEQELEENGKDKEDREKSSILEMIFSPATFFGAILVGVISGVIVALITKNRN